MNDPERPANEPELRPAEPERPANEAERPANEREHRTGAAARTANEPASAANERVLAADGLAILANAPERPADGPVIAAVETAHAANEPVSAVDGPVIAAGEPELQSGLMPDDAELPPVRAPLRNVVVDGAVTLFLLLAFASPLVLIFAGVAGAMLGIFSQPAGTIVAILTGLVLLVLTAVRLYRWVRDGGRERAVRVIGVLTLFILPPWGFVYNHFVVEPQCTVGACSDKYFRPFAEPEIFGLLAFHAVTVLAYYVSRRRPEALRPAGEALVHTTLLAGIVVHAVVAVHLAPWTAKAFVLPPVLLPLFTPAVTVCLYTGELLRRLRRRGQEAAAAIEPPPAPTAYRHAPPQPLPALPRVHRGLLLRAMALTPALLGVHAVLHALWLGRADGALRVLTRTCDHVLSLQPVVILPEDCHYLCTVAARGHAWLVRPARLGRRRGITIVVNRQLAVANAFEDLLHERWPRFGRLARRLYDKLGLPVSRLIRGPWLADLTYLAMKPAEWLFALTLLLLDRDSPERRIDRMYR